MTHKCAAALLESLECQLQACVEEHARLGDAFVPRPWTPIRDLAECDLIVSALHRLDDREEDRALLRSLDRLIADVSNVVQHDSDLSSDQKQIKATQKRYRKMVQVQQREWRKRVNKWQIAEQKRLQILAIEERETRLFAGVGDVA